MAALDATSLARVLCPELVERVAQRGDRTFLISPFRYPDGDSVNVYVDRLGSEYVLSDRGTTFFKAFHQLPEWSEKKLEIVDVICRTNSVERVGHVLRSRLTGDGIGRGYLAFCEAITRISTFEYDSEAKQRSTLTETVGELLATQVDAQRTVSRHWTYADVDPNGSFPVDFRVSGASSAVHLFAVGSAPKSTLVSAVSAYLRLNNIDLPTMAIVAPEVHLSRRQIDRLQRAATEIRFGVVDNESSIVEFARSAA